MVVKGSKQYRPVVVPYEPGKRLLWIVFCTLLVCGLMAGSFWLGYQEAQKDQRLALEEWAQLQSRVAEQVDQIQSLSTQLSNSQVGTGVDQQAMEVLRKEILELNQKNVALQESNEFYRQLMEPTADTKGLTIGDLNIQPTPLPRQYHYQLLIQQVAREPRLLLGQASITVVGTLAGQPKKYALHELSSQFSAAEIPLKFRFFQTLEGYLTLPEGFSVQRVEVLVEKNGSATPVQRHFDWQPSAQVR